MRQVIGVHGNVLELDLPVIVGLPVEQTRCDICGIKIYSSSAEARYDATPYWPYDNKRIDGCLCFDCAVGKILDALGLHALKFEIADMLEPPSEGVGCCGEIRPYENEASRFSYRVWHRPQKDGACLVHGWKRAHYITEAERPEAERLIKLWEGG